VIDTALTLTLLPSNRALPHLNGTANLQRTSTSSLSSNNGPDYQPRFASRLSSSRLASVATATPVGSHDQIVGTATHIDPMVAPTAALGAVGQPASATAVLARSTSSSNAQPQQYVTMTQTTTTTFCYVPASTSLAYNALTTGANRTAPVPHH
jgi:hypothetical protein